ncbi:hypothetical protein BKK79_19045 [Cupriavidus sp. USMAA2-4]|uniref:hypothetical protein n=1 Tax=Cupriavidus sp. USMAA2-4 TaxID=876364 RepID=UPI0008A6BB5E|nr:hypothetical protein [Cupriavidus sp. USMAA2-4]AOY93667.1 hypothetical protein BKK79_19045 [Cupriavidus sp. USMAA2-4]
MSALPLVIHGIARRQLVEQERHLAGRHVLQRLRAACHVVSCAAGACRPSSMVQAGATHGLASGAGDSDAAAAALSERVPA